MFAVRQTRWCRTALHAVLLLSLAGCEGPGCVPDGQSGGGGDYGNGGGGGAGFDVGLPTANNATMQRAEGQDGLTFAVVSVEIPDDTVTRTQTITVDYATSDLLATSGEDYTAVQDTLSFPPGTSQLDISIQVFGDYRFEPNETFLITLTNPVGAVITQDTYTVSITNDDVLDTTPPQVTAVTPADGGTEVPTNPTIQVTFSEPLDYASMPARANPGFRLRVEGGADPGTAVSLPGTVAYALNAETARFQPDDPLSANTTYVILLTGAIKDRAGNPLDTGSGLKIEYTFTTAAGPDSTPPTTSSSLTAGTYGTTQTLDLNCTDGLSGSGCAATYYCEGVGCTPGLIFTGEPITVASASFTLRFHSVDNAGNEEAIHTRTYTISNPDAIAPATTATPVGGLYAGPQAVTLSCVDGTGGAGCGATDYCTGAACVPATAYTGPIPIAGSETLRFRSTDGAGNVEATVTEVYTIAGPPSADIMGNGAVQAVAPALDGGHFLAGDTSDLGSAAPPSTLWVMRLNPDGTSAWSIDFGDATTNSAALALDATADGGVIVAGYRDDGDYFNADFWVLKLDGDGTVQWQKQYDAGTRELAYAVQETVDESGNPDGFIVGGTTQLGGGDAWVLRLAPDGTVVWQQRYGGPSVFDNDFLRDLIVTDTGYAFVGQSGAIGNGDVWLVQLDRAGAMVTQATVGHILWGDEGYSLAQIPGGGFVVAGTTDRRASTEGTNIWLMRFNADGITTAWETMLGSDSNDGVGQVIRTSDGGFVTVGSSATGLFAATRSDVWLVKVDADGNLLWQMAHGGAEVDLGLSLTESATGGLLAGGVSWSFGITNATWVLRLDVNGDIDVSCTSAGATTASETPLFDTPLTSVVHIATEALATVTDTQVVGDRGTIIPDNQCVAP